MCQPNTNRPCSREFGEKGTQSSVPDEQSKGQGRAAWGVTAASMFNDDSQGGVCKGVCTMVWVGLSVFQQT